MTKHQIDNIVTALLLVAACVAPLPVLYAQETPAAVLWPLWTPSTPQLLEYETQYLTFNEHATASFSCLGDGWRGEGVHTFMATGNDFWARSRLADIEVSVLAPRDLDLHLTMRPAFVEALGAQRVEVVWNGERLGVCAFDLKCGWQAEDFKFSVPRSIQVRGKNGISFVSRFAVSRKEMNLDEDGRRHAFSLLRVALTPPGAAPAEVERPVLLQEGEEVRQPANTLLRYPIAVPETGTVRFGMGAPQIMIEGGEWAVWLRADGIENPIELKLFSAGADPPYVFDLVPFRGQTVEFVFDTTGGSPQSAVTWRRPRIESINASPPVTETPTGPARADNVLLIVCDAARAAALGCYGHVRNTTPTIDLLAAEGTLFERAYSTAPDTYGAMWSVVTSLYPFQHGAPAAPLRAPDTAPRIEQTLKAAGIYTGCIAQVQEVSPQTGIAEHYDEYGRAYETQEMIESGARPDLLTAQAVDFLGRNKDRRFFLYLHYRSPRAPYIPSAPSKDSFTTDPANTVDLSTDWMAGLKTGEFSLKREEQLTLEARYDESLRAVDQDIATLLEYLVRLNLRDKTLVVFTSSHGEAFGEHGYYTHGQTLYEEVTRVPLVLSGPGVREVLPIKTAEPVSMIDLYPTLCDVLGVEKPASLSGTSLLRQVPANASSIRAYAQGNWLVESLTFEPSEAYWWPRYKLVRNTAGAGLEVYDLDRDPQERINLALFRPVLADYLLAEALAWPRTASPVAEVPPETAAIEPAQQ